MSNHKYFGMTEEEWSDYYQNNSLHQQLSVSKELMGKFKNKFYSGLIDQKNQDFKLHKKVIGQDFVPKEQTQVDGTHYEDMEIQPWDVMESLLTHDEFLGYLKGCIIKYSMRQGKKSTSPKDGKKCKDYIKKLIEIQGKI